MLYIHIAHAYSIKREMRNLYRHTPEEQCDKLCDTVWRRKVFAAAAAAAIYSKNSEILAHSAVHYIINGN